MEKKIRTLSTIYAKHFSVSLDEVELTSGRKSERIKVDHPDASAVLAFIDEHNVLMVRQYRYAADEVTLEIPAGKIDPGETPEECILRELIEETGYKIQNPADLTHLTTYLPALGYSNEKLHIYHCKTLSKIEDAIIPSDEIDNIEIVPLIKVKEMIKEKIIVDGKTIIAIALYECFK